MTALTPPVGATSSLLVRISQKRKLADMRSLICLLQRKCDLSVKPSHEGLQAVISNSKPTISLVINYSDG